MSNEQNRNHDFESLMNWIKVQVKKNPYSEISLRVCVHDGRVKRIERSLLEKLK